MVLYTASLGITWPLAVASPNLENFLRITAPAPLCLYFPFEARTLSANGFGKFNSPRKSISMCVFSIYLSTSSYNLLLDLQ